MGTSVYVVLVLNTSSLTNTPTAAIVNGTLYVYGGQATTTARQTENTWSEIHTSPYPKSVLTCR